MKVGTKKMQREFKSKTKKNSNMCSPQNKENDFSCFSKPALIKMIDSWNKSYKTNKINKSASDSKLNLWRKLDSKLKGICNDEFCWTQKIPTPQNVKYELEDNFKPKMPTKWNDHKLEWLTTIDIEKVLKQYQKKHKNFAFIGAVPIDFDYKPNPGQCIINELCKLNVEKMLKKGKINLGVVFNLDKHYEDGSHWVAMYARLNKGEIYYYDSYAYKPPKEVTVLMERIKSQCQKLKMNAFIETNDIRHQRKNSECGVYCINFITKMLNNFDFDTIKRNIIKDDDMNAERENYFLRQP
jgi:hypothetical protein